MQAVWKIDMQHNGAWVHKGTAIAIKVTRRQPIPDRTNEPNMDDEVLLLTCQHVIRPKTGADVFGPLVTENGKIRCWPEAYGYWPDTCDESRVWHAEVKYAPKRDAAEFDLGCRENRQHDWVLLKVLVKWRRA